MKRNLKLVIHKAIDFIGVFLVFSLLAQQAEASSSKWLLTTGSGVQIPPLQLKLKRKPLKNQYFKGFFFFYPKVTFLVKLPPITLIYPPGVNQM